MTLTEFLFRLALSILPVGTDDRIVNALWGICGALVFVAIVIAMKCQKN
jgi:hypothetical protein